MLDAISEILVIASAVNFNFTDFTAEGILRVAFDPYYHIFGNFTWGAILGFIGAGLYANERSIGTIATYLILVGIFASILFPYDLALFFGIILAFVMGVIFYISFIESRS